MGLLDRLRGAATRAHPAPGSEPTFNVVHGEDTWFRADALTLDLMRAGRARRPAQEQFYVLDMLTEDGRATAHDEGFVVSAEEVSRLGAEEAAIIGLPPRFVGALEVSVYRWTASPDFRVDLDVRAGAHREAPERRGAVIWSGQRLHRTSAPLLRALRAVEAHAALGRSERTEAANVRLVAQLQAAQRLATGEVDEASRDEHFHLSLGALDRFATVTPGKVGLVVEPQRDGSLVVEPDLGDVVDQGLLSRRWHQLDRQVGDQDPDQEPPDGRPVERTEGAVLRAGDTLVLLGPDQLAAVQEVRARPRIPADRVQSFLKAPGSYFDPDLVDVDIRFSVRVEGLGLLAPVTFYDASSSGIDWFTKVTGVVGPETLVDVARTPGELVALESRLHEAWEGDQTVLATHEQLVDISDRHLVEEAVAASRRRIAALGLTEVVDETQRPSADSRSVTVGLHILNAVDISDRLREHADGARPQDPVDYAQMSRAPFPHQRTGVEWMTGLIQAALGAPEGDPGRIQGALLADDMGLGKTFMVLVALAEAQRWQQQRGREPLPALAVMPVALLETWLAEIRTAFGSAHGPFDDVVVLQGPGLADYRLSGAGSETSAREEDLDSRGMVREDRIHASLRIGPRWGEARLDRPGTLVLTTYETLRRYQVSLGLVDWGVVVLDEAQATKNPTILATRAVKGLKARFKLLATGTPVENSLRDFWSLMDTAQPGLLGTWTQFQAEWVTPMDAASGVEHERLGRALRDSVGAFMLRRVKEDHLEDLPKKHVHELPHLMPAMQVEAYDGVLARHRTRSGRKGAALMTLHELARASLHPGLLGGPLDGDATTLDQSARTLVTVRVVLDEVRRKGEKAIIFAKTREIQRALALWLCDLYGFRVDIVNGDTAATGRGETRMAKIRAFEAREGFNVIIMSPLAAGVGLTVVGANHAIHLERHWNPAKEAQATDRIHRIGQQREVHVHYPVALHPALDSFDLNLDRLLRSKTALKDAVVVPQEVPQDQLERALGL